MVRKYEVKVGEVYKKWRVLEIEIMQISGKKKDRRTYNNALCICTQCNKNTQILSYKRLHDKNGSFMCAECDGQKNKTTEEYIKDLQIKNPLLKLKNGEKYVNNKIKLIHICQMCGKEFSISPNTALKGKSTCRECGIKRQSVNLKWDTNKYIEELDKKNPFVKLKKGEKYITNNVKIKHICSQCGKDWNVAPVNTLRGETMCKKCSTKLTESVHATLIKQVYKHHYKEDCMWEERINIEEKTYEIDIVNHKKKEAIEIDGQQHYKISKFHKEKAKKNNTTPEYEFEQQKLRDHKINKYFKEIGYNLIRIKVGSNKTPLQALQEVFPQYNYLPKWIDFSNKRHRHKWDVGKAQQMINNNVHLSEIARRLKTHPSSLTQAINYGQLILPEYFKKQKIVYWDIKKAQELINEGNTVKQVALAVGVPHSTIRGALDRKAIIRNN